MTSPNTKQPRSIPTDTPAVWDLVFADMQERDLMGEKKHGVRLQPGNGRDVLKDAYQEALDLVAYLRQSIYERDEQADIATLEQEVRQVRARLARVEAERDDLNKASSHTVRLFDELSPTSAARYINLSMNGLREAIAKVQS